MSFILYIFLLFLFYALLMFFIHTIFHYIKNNYTTKKELNLANIQQKKYQEIAEYIHQRQTTHPPEEKLFSNNLQLDVVSNSLSHTEAKYLEDSLLQVLNEVDTNI